MGHCVCFPHDAPSKLAKLPALSTQELSVVIVRSPGKSSAVSKAEDTFRIRFDYVMLWLNWLKRNNPFYCDIGIDTSAENWNDILCSVEQTATIESEDAAGLEDATTSNVADEEQRSEIESVFVARRPVQNGDASSLFRSVADLVLPATVRPALASTPTNEFEDNGDSIMTAFPWLFPWGRGLGDVSAGVPTISCPKDLGASNETATCCFCSLTNGSDTKLRDLWRSVKRSKSRHFETWSEARALQRG